MGHKKDLTYYCFVRNYIYFFVYVNCISHCDCYTWLFVVVCGGWGGHSQSLVSRNREGSGEGGREGRTAQYIAEILLGSYHVTQYPHHTIYPQMTEVFI